MDKYFKMKELGIIIIICHLFVSCCSYKMDKHDKENLIKMVNSPYSFPERKPVRAIMLDIGKYNLKVALFPKEYGDFSNIENQFTPSVKDIENAEQKMLDRATKNNTEAIFKKYEYRQYIGKISKEGKKQLYINLLDFKTKCRKKTSDYFLLDKYFIDMLDNNRDPFRDIEIITL
ncbi:hypothetical protein ACSTS3_21560 [Aquimarina muelleri]|uniref:hypothetical protein n=1 Tax=Aquimarina muelleri TaxID=279356 RepID=UPI003F6876F6